MHRVLFIAAVVLAVCSSLYARDYYISADGDGAAGDGTIGKPYQTINKVNGLTLNPRDRVFFHGGTNSGVTVPFIVQHRTSLTEGVWTNIQSVLRSEGMTQQWTHPGSNGRFYRIVIPEP